MTLSTDFYVGLRVCFRRNEQPIRLEFSIQLFFEISRCLCALIAVQSVKCWTFSIISLPKMSWPGVAWRVV